MTVKPKKEESSRRGIPDLRGNFSLFLFLLSSSALAQLRSETILRSNWPNPINLILSPSLDLTFSLYFATSLYWDFWQRRTVYAHAAYLKSLTSKVVEATQQLRKEKQWTTWLIALYSRGVSLLFFLLLYGRYSTKKSNAAANATGKSKLGLVTALPCDQRHRYVMIPPPPPPSHRNTDLAVSGGLKYFFCKYKKTLNHKNLQARPLPLFRPTWVGSIRPLFLRKLSPRCGAQRRRRPRSQSGRIRKAFWNGN